MLVPFYQWQRQEIPFFFKTYAEHPERYAVYSKTKQHVENLSEPPKTPPPGYYQGQIRLPVKDQSGDNLYYDPTYSLPFGSMIKGAGENDMPFGFNPNPLLDLGPILKNQHPEYGTPLSKSADPGEVNKAIVRQVAETFGPNAVREIGTNLPAALKGEEEPYTGKNRSLRQFVYKQLGTKIAGYSEKKQLQSTQFKLKDIEDNYKSMRYKLLDQLKRRVIDQKTYQEKLKLERDAYLKAKQNAASN